MQLKQLDYFVTSVKEGSFKAAAVVLYTTQPNVSKTVKALEEELNVTLFKRNPHGIELTMEGKRVYEYAVEILNYVEKMKDA